MTYARKEDQRSPREIRNAWKNKESPRWSHLGEKKKEKRNQRKKKRSGPRGKTREGTSARILERDSAQKAQTERYEQIKYEVEGESEEPEKRKDGGGLRKGMKGIGTSRKTSAKT